MTGASSRKGSGHPLGASEQCWKHPKFCRLVFLFHVFHVFVTFLLSGVFRSSSTFASLVFFLQRHKYFCIVDSSMTYCERIGNKDLEIYRDILILLKYVFYTHIWTHTKTLIWSSVSRARSRATSSISVWEYSIFLKNTFCVCTTY